MSHPEFSNAELIQLFEKVDSELAAEGVRLFGREIRALGEVSKILGLTLRITTPTASSTSEPWPTDYISLALYRWYEERYGDKLKSDFSVGTAAVIIRGDIWQIRIPSIYGRARVYCRPESIPSPRLRTHSKRLFLNVLDHVHELTKGLRVALSDDELKHVFGAFTLAYTAYYEFMPFKAAPLVTSCLADHEAAVNSLLTLDPHYGQSRWSSLQAAEKALKFFISSKGAAYPYVHDLSRLASQASSLGLAGISDDIIEAIQCNADVRYRHTTSRQLALAGHYSSLILTGIVGNTLEI